MCIGKPANDPPVTRETIEKLVHSNHNSIGHKKTQSGQNIVLNQNNAQNAASTSQVNPEKTKLDSRRIMRPSKNRMNLRSKKLVNSEASNLNKIDKKDPYFKLEKVKNLSSTSFDPSSVSVQHQKISKSSHFRNKSQSADIRKPKQVLNPLNKQITFAVRTKKGMNGNSKKMNQDSFTAVLNFRENAREHLFGVFDGHGTNGHLVSNFLSSNLASTFQSKLSQNGAPDIALHNTYKKLFDSLLKGSIDIAFSGSTAVTCFIQDGVVYCANCGDSRAILGVEGEDGQFTFKKLSVDHKLDIPAERERVESQGGKVEEYVLQSGEKCGPLRVWLPGKNVPGLAMSRSIGDLVAASVGVLWNPGTHCVMIRGGHYEDR